jgi:hypothetical protein
MMENLGNISSSVSTISLLDWEFYFWGNNAIKHSFLG